MSTSAHGAPALLLDDVCKRYGDFTALSGINLRIEPGEIVVLLGANGAGKTTLMSTAAALCRPDSGRVWVDGIDMLARPSQGQRRLGIATQETGIYPTLSVRDNLRFFGELAGVRRAPLERRLQEIAEAFGLAQLLERSARLLSAGQARRLHTAMVLLRRPLLLLLDEPTTGVDISARARMLEFVRGLAADGSAVCYSSHHLAEAEQLKATVAIIHGGSIVARGSREALISLHGKSAVELRFDGPPPTLAGMHSVQASDTALLITADDAPEIDMARVFTTLGDAAKRLRTVRLIHPDLESVFCALTEQQLLQPTHNGSEAQDDIRL